MTIEILQTNTHRLSSGHSAEHVLLRIDGKLYENRSLVFTPNVVKPLLVEIKESDLPAVRSAYPGAPI